MRKISALELPGSGHRSTHGVHVGAFLRHLPAAILGWVAEPPAIGVCDLCGDTPAGPDGRCDKHFRVI